MSNLIIPDLELGTRSREFKSYKEMLRDKIVYEYLFNSKSHRKLDESVLGLNATESKGYQSMNILHYLGLKGKHKGIFSGLELEVAIAKLRDAGEQKFSLVIQSLERYSEQKYSDKNDNEGKEYPEGKEAYQLHRIRERDSRVVKKAKELFYKKHGSLFCEACEFNFEEIYGERGKGFIEAHHTKPVSEMKDGEVTRVEDIAMLCSNCHRMIHKKPFITVKQLRELLYT